MGKNEEERKCDYKEKLTIERALLNQSWLFRFYLICILTKVEINASYISLFYVHIHFI